jgi:translocation and assembly module TamA
MPYSFLALLLCCCLAAWPVMAEEPPPPPAEKVEVLIEGIDGLLLNNARIFLGIYQQRAHPQLNAARLKRLHRQAEKEIGEALRALGYYRAKVVAGELHPPEQAGQPWQAIYRVEPGPPLPVRRLNARILGDGQVDSAFDEVLLDFPLKQGGNFDHGAYEKSKAALQKLAEARGYFEARFVTHRFKVDLEAYQADVDLLFDTGPRYRFGEISFAQDEFSEKLLKDFLTFAPGDYYSADALLSFRNGLTQSDYFKTIETHSRRMAETKEVKVRVVLGAGRKNTYRIRLGYGTDSGPRGMVEWERTVNRQGHRMLARLGVSQNRNKYAAKLNYLIPIGRIKDDYLNIGVRYNGEDFDYNQLSFAGQGGSTRLEDASIMLSRHHRRIPWKEIKIDEVWSLEYLLERYDLLNLLFTPEEVEILGDYLTPEERMVLSPDFKVLIPGISWTYLRADDPVYSRRGYRVRFGLRGSHEALASSLSFWQARLNLQGIQAWGKGRLIARADFGYTDAETVESLNANVLPYEVQFRTGGDRSLRGYEFEELAGDTALVGGKHLIVGSLEYEHRFLEKWSGALFFDMGNAFNSFSEIAPKRGAGVGVRWHSPVGLVRFDVATALSREGNPWRIHLTIGPDF